MTKLHFVHYNYICHYLSITVTISLYSEPVPDPDTKVIPVFVSFVASTVVVSASADATVFVSVFVVKVVDESVVLGAVVGQDLHNLRDFFFKDTWKPQYL